MQEIGRNTLFLIGDSQVGKTTIARHLFEPHNLTLVWSNDGATEYEVLIQGREFPVKIIEIRSYDFLTQNTIKFEKERDAAFFCYTIDNPDSFNNVVKIWIPLFKRHVRGMMTMVLVGNKKDLGQNAEVIHNSAEWGLQPVSRDEATELLNLETMDASVESGNSDFDLLHQAFLETIIDTILDYN